jgi:hypothetical protein
VTPGVRQPCCRFHRVSSHSANGIGSPAPAGKVLSGVPVFAPRKTPALTKRSKRQRSCRHERARHRQHRESESSAPALQNVPIMFAPVARAFRPEVFHSVIVIAPARKCLTPERCDLQAWSLPARRYRNVTAILFGAPTECSSGFTPPAPQLGGINPPLPGVTTRHVAADLQRCPFVEPA